jgi:uncharacterized protein with PIN domain
MMRCKSCRGQVKKVATSEGSQGNIKFEIYECIKCGLTYYQEKKK